MKTVFPAFMLCIFLSSAFGIFPALAKPVSYAQNPSLYGPPPLLYTEQHGPSSAPAVASSPQEKIVWAASDPPPAPTTSEKPHGPPRPEEIIVDNDEAEKTRSSIAHVERAEDSQLILELLTEGDQQIVLDPGMIVYMEGDDVLVPLGAFAKLLEFQISVDTREGTAKGWFIGQENTFDLAPPYDAVRIGGKSRNIAGLIEPHKDDIYISQKLLSEWFPLDLTLNFNQLRLYMKTDVDLPFQQRAKRQAKWESAAIRQRSAIPGKDGPVVQLPYKLFSPPVVEMSHGVNFNKTGSDQSALSDHSFNAEGDLLGMNGRLSMAYRLSSSEREEIDNIQFNLSKENYNGGLLGPLSATQYELGDVTVHSFPLAGGGGRGRGVSLDNAPYNFVRDPDNFRIEGFAPVDWDVEVYQDQNLLNFQKIRADGRYSFTALPLREGFNLFRIVLYGPNGEREERFERFFLGQDMVEKGKFIYEMSALQSSTPLLDVSLNPPDETSHTLSLLGEYGLTNNLSVNSGFYRGPAGAGSLEGFGAGLRMSAASTFSQLNTFFDNSGARSVSFDVRGNMTKDFSFSLGRTLHLDYEPNIRGTKEESFARSAWLFNITPGNISSLSFELREERSDDDVEKDSFNNRFSTGLYGMNLSNELEYTKYDDGRDDTFTGELTLRKNTEIGTVRGRLVYDLGDEADLTQADVETQTNVTKDLFLTTQLTTLLGDSELTTIGAGVDWRLDTCRISFNSTINDERDVTASLRLIYNLIPNSLKGDYSITGRTEDINAGRLVLRPFVDANQNGVMDGDEKTLAGISFRNTLRGTTSALTGKDGTVVLGGISPRMVNPVMLEAKTLPDIYMVAGVDSINILGKSGISGPVDYPVRQLGEINGRLIFFDGNNEEVSLSDVTIVLVDSTGKEVAKALTEYDGYYSFPSLQMGTYRMLFPGSGPLDLHYSGDGVGPLYVLTPENPERIDNHLVVLPRLIVTYDNYIAGNIESMDIPLPPPANAVAQVKEYPLESITYGPPVLRWSKLNTYGPPTPVQPTLDKTLEKQPLYTPPEPLHREKANYGPPPPLTPSSGIYGPPEANVKPTYILPFPAETKVYGPSQPVLPRYRKIK